MLFCVPLWRGGEDRPDAGGDGSFEEEVHQEGDAVGGLDTGAADAESLTAALRRGLRRGLSLGSGPDEKVASDFTSVPDPIERRFGGESAVRSDAAGD